MFAEKLICSWIGALGLAGAFGQTYVQISADAFDPLLCENQDLPPIFP